MAKIVEKKRGRGQVKVEGKRAIARDKHKIEDQEVD